MRAAVDVTPLIGARTGIGELVAGLVNALQLRNDVEVVPVALTWRGRGEAGARHAPIPARLVQRLWQHTELLPITTWTGRVDVIHGTNYVVGPRPRRGRVARIVTVHDLAPVKTPHLCNPATLVFPRLVQRAVQTGAVVQTDSLATAEEVREWLRIAPDRVRCVHPGLNALVPPDPQGLDATLSGGQFVLTLGTEEPRKGLGRMAAALPQLLAEHSDLRWVHAGSTGWGSEELDNHLAKLAEPHRNAAIRLGRITQGQKSWLLRNAAAFVYPSIDEGFGFPPLEALSVGTPVVCADLPVLREVVGPSATFVDASDPSALSSAVSRAVSLRQQEVSTAGAVHAAAYTWERAGSAQVDWYRDAMQACQ